MACKCPVCKETSANADEMLEHIVNSPDSKHEKWLQTYCTKKKIDFARMLLQRLNMDMNGSKPLAAALKKDFCKD